MLKVSAQTLTGWEGSEGRRAPHTMRTASPERTLVSTTLSELASLSKERGFVPWAPYLVASREVVPWGCGEEDVPSPRTPLSIPWSRPGKKNPLGSVGVVPRPPSCAGAPDGEVRGAPGTWECSVGCRSTVLYRRSLWRKLFCSVWNLASQWISCSLT